MVFNNGGVLLLIEILIFLFLKKLGEKEDEFDNVNDDKICI